jgi:hypothetical protein
MSRSYIPLDEVRAERLAREAAAKAAQKREHGQASAARFRANRRNARKSTGPRTAAGKAHAAHNAISHGLYCQDLILPGESRRAFLSMRLAYHADLKATDAIEFAIVERAVIAQWHLRRAQSAEADLHAATAQRPIRRINRKLARLRAELGDPRHDCTDELRAATAQRLGRIAKQKRLRSALRDDGLPAAATLAMDFAHAWSGSLERLARHAQRLENHFYKAMRELRAHRKEKRADGFKLADAEPYADLAQMTRELEACAREQELDEQDEHENEDDDVRRGVVASATTSSTPNAQNEPNSDESRAGDDAHDGCEQGSRTIEPVAPTTLAPRGARIARDDRKEARDRT